MNDPAFASTRAGSRPRRRGHTAFATPSHAATGALGEALVASLDRLSHGIAIFDMHRRTRFANAAALNLMRRLGWTTPDPAEPTLAPVGWVNTLRRVCLRGFRELLNVEAQALRTAVVLTPLHLPEEDLAHAIFGREELCGNVEIQMFALQHQLTHAESAVLRQLSQGLDAAAIATAHRVARTTVLTQIASVRSKTGSASVRALMAELARLPPLNPLQLVRPSSDPLLPRGRTA